MVIQALGLGLQALQFGVNAYASQKATREAKRSTRDEVRAANAEIMRQIGQLGSESGFDTAQRNLVLGAAGVKGGSTLGATVENDAGLQLRKQQELLARGLSDQLLQSGEKKETLAFKSDFFGLGDKPVPYKPKPSAQDRAAKLAGNRGGSDARGGFAPNNFFRINDRWL